MEKTALILIDYQMDYFAGGRMELAQPVPAVEKAARLLDCFHNSRAPVFILQHISLRPDATFFLPDTDGIALHPLLQPAETDIVLQKHYPNSFRKTGLKKLIDKQGIKNLVISGMMSHMCVDATVRAAFDHEFSCRVIHDACATRNIAFADREICAADVHGAFMSALGAVYAELMTTEECIRKLQPTTTH